MMTGKQKQLAEQNIGLVRWYISKHNLDFEEYAGDLAETLCKAAISYKDECDIKFATYAVAAFDNCVKMKIIRKNAKKRVPECMVSSLEEAVSWDSDKREVRLFDLVSDNRDAIGDILTLDWFDEYVNTLSEMNRKILMMRINGESQQEISKSVNLTQPMVSRILKKIGKEIMRELQA